MEEDFEVGREGNTAGMSRRLSIIGTGNQGREACKGGRNRGCGGDRALNDVVL